MITKKNLNKQLRMDAAMAERVTALVARSGLSESDILRMTLAAGLEQIETGKYNPLALKESSPSYGKTHKKA